MTAVFYCRIDSPIGELVLTSNGEALTQVIMQSERRGSRLARIDGWRRDDARLAAARAQLAAYFAGELQNFDLALAADGTVFQHRVWAALRAIPYGATASYGDIARRIGQPSASRAVGLANGSNPIPIIVPCHRVIGANGSMTGFGGGIERKRWLLTHEARRAAKGPGRRNETADLFGAVP
ncbi:MAG TPA: methylated-DNA--[protein]-cysteine S-methyltransferase [Burkholderiaceae bacterium]|nr:methylated-DNA--[protein]-cysteine S-methyltransferase [Burkholderiaceae bacterium]